MNLVLLYPSDFISEVRVRLQGRRLKYVAEVHRAKVGDTLKVGLLGAKMGHGRVSTLSDAALEMDVSLNEDPPQKLPLTLAVALPRPKVLNRVIAAATSLGAERIILMNAWKVEKSYWKSPRLLEENLLHQRILGLEQGVDTLMPELHVARFFAPFVRDELPKIALGTKCFVAHPQAKHGCPAGINEPCSLVLGPEGGFIQDELSALENIGFQPICLGKRILRIESAIPAFAGRLFG
jgi:RsmE family RNA methyltransferase